VQVQQCRSRSEYAKPWLHWAVGLLYLVVLDLKRMQNVPAEEVAKLVADSPGLRGMQDVHFAKLLEKLLRLVTNLKVRSMHAMHACVRRQAAGCV
jgi:hypothetical protein